jgi:hypothetical protein
MELLTRKSFKYRIYSTKSQVFTLENQFSMCRHLYNWNLVERIETYQKDETTISYNQQQNKLPALKEERPWFKSVHSQVLQDVLRRLDNGYQAFFRRIKKMARLQVFPSSLPMLVGDAFLSSFATNPKSFAKMLFLCRPSTHLRYALLMGKWLKNPCQLAHIVVNAALL